MRNSVIVALLVIGSALLASVSQAEDQRDPNWRWSNSPSNPDNAPYKANNTSKVFSNSPTNPKNIEGSSTRVDIIEKNLLKLLETNVGYGVERDQLPNGAGSYINIFDNDGERAGYCPKSSFAQLKSLSGVYVGDIAVKDDGYVCFDADGDPMDVIFRFKS